MFDDQKLAVLAAVDGLAEVAEQKVTELQNQVDTANLQHGNDQATIGGLQITLDAANNNLGKAQAALDKANAQLAVKVYPDLEFNGWSMNWNAVVGGSGLGKATNTSAEKAADKYGVFTLTPDPPTAAQNGKNWFDCYYTKTFAADDTKKNYRLTTSWVLPTAADVASCRCLEMEARHIIKGGAMFVVACQLDFADNSLRYWAGPNGKWQPSIAPQPRLVPGQVYTVILEGHRDDTNVYHDQLTLNGVVTKLGTKYAASNAGWGPAIKCSLQLDGMNTAYNAKHKTKYEVW